MSRDHTTALHPWQQSETPSKKKKKNPCLLIPKSVISGSVSTHFSLLGCRSHFLLHIPTNFKNYILHIIDATLRAWIEQTSVKKS